MTPIRLTNSLTRRKEDFLPLDWQDPAIPEAEKRLRMYVCGPTVYDRAHLGNARPVVVFDVLYRLLRHLNGESAVTYVRNFTDVDDRINATALARKEAGAEGTLEALIHDRSNETIGWYHDDMDALGALRPTHEPRATEFIGPMVAMIEALIARRHAYVSEGHVLFSVDSWAESYGNLSGRSVEDMIAGARVEVAPYKRNPMDFVLWKPSDADLPGWESPWGRGRPGWHIECSAMAHAILGENFDIHGGGSDLLFPHHENEIAQSCCAWPGSGFAKIWLHNEMLMVEGRKMSKSLGNFFTVRDLLDQGVPGEVIRFVLLGTHYRKPMDWTEEKRLEAEIRLHGFVEMIARYGDVGAAMALQPEPAIIDALADDLNTHAALECLGKMSSAGDANNLARNLVFLGILSENEIAHRAAAFQSGLALLERWGSKLQALRLAALETKDFSEVDRVKDFLTARHVSVQMTKEGVNLRPELDFDPAKLESLK